jgi:hypothetical protein
MSEADDLSHGFEDANLQMDINRRGLLAKLSK